ncbi:hypothetical protein QBC41DRAFT_374919 [Cercophora samala]|uniref:Uncharacterized protein n=1 Tax=Cercophora samala TaxID=330535 RepID=A0AA39ZA47_9PEZI|nr:hypothetical protein QBC41DRAFT_374919 [Cercophora samala]
MASDGSFPRDKCKALHKDALRCEQPTAPDSAWCAKHHDQKAVIYGLTKHHKSRVNQLEYLNISPFNNPEHAVEVLSFLNQVIALRILTSICFFPSADGIEDGHNIWLTKLGRRRDDATFAIRKYRREGHAVDLEPYVSLVEWVQRLREEHCLLDDPDRVREDAISWDVEWGDDGHDYTTSDGWLDWAIQMSNEKHPGPEGDPPPLVQHVTVQTDNIPDQAGAEEEARVPLRARAAVLINEVRFVGSRIKYDYRVTMKPVLQRVFESLRNCFKDEREDGDW